MRQAIDRQSTARPWPASAMVGGRQQRANAGPGRHSARVSRPRAVLGVIRSSKASYRKMLQNLGWGAGYNIGAIPLAAGVFA
jgi:hypothetical protein